MEALRYYLLWGPWAAMISPSGAVDAAVEPRTWGITAIIAMEPGCEHRTGIVALT